MPHAGRQAVSVLACRPTLRTLSLYRSSPLEGRLSDEAVTQSGEPLGDLVGG